MPKVNKTKNNPFGLTYKQDLVVKDVVEKVANGKKMRLINSVEKFYDVKNRSSANQVVRSNLQNRNFREALVAGLTERRVLGNDSLVEEKLMESCEPNWVVVPRRKRLEPLGWSLIDGKPDVDYMYLSKDLHGKVWDELNTKESLKAVMVDDLISSQGSAYFMHRSYFNELELLDEETYGPFASEFQEVGLKCWLSGGRVVVNKNTWYSHWHKTDGRGYPLERDPEHDPKMQGWYEMGKMWKKQTLPIEWLFKKQEEYGRK